MDLKEATIAEVHTPKTGKLQKTVGLSGLEPHRNRLDSWKQIAAYLNREVRTVQRWEKHERLPLHRHFHAKGGTVYAFKEEIDSWLIGRGQTPIESRLMQRPPLQAANGPNPLPQVTRHMFAVDLEIAKRVQARLFPQKLPPLSTLEYGGRCIQARHVGGDYYDFLSLGSGRIGLLLADIAGKGIAGALLMASLQAIVRSRCSIASQDLAQFLKSVNRSFCESTDEASYATLFFGDYDDCTRRLRFVNSGHNPRFLVHRDGTYERLAATATVLGLFEDWQPSITEVRIAAGDMLVIYTDGITEARDSAGEDFGEARPLETIRASADLPVSQIVDVVLAAALDFTGGKKSDDLTLVVARGR